MGCFCEIGENERKTRQKWPLCDLVRGGCVAGGDGAAEDAAVAERERRGGWVTDGDYATLVPCATGEGWIGGERFNGSLGVVGSHDGFSFLLTNRSCASSQARQPKPSAETKSKSTSATRRAR